ncbi:MAG: hypothetical protein QM750_15705 [Rubrivivax sp.]
MNRHAAICGPPHRQAQGLAKSRRSDGSQPSQEDHHVCIVARSIIHPPLALAALAACGGGGGDDSGGSTSTLALTGTAATSAAAANVPAEAKCRGGNGSGTTQADGSFSLTLPAGAALPCMLKVTVASDALHSLATGSGSSARANVTSVTELVVAQATGMQPESVHQAFTGANAPSDSTLGAAKTAAAATLAAGGVDLSTSGDVISGALVAAGGSASANAYGQTLAALGSKLDGSGTTLAALTSATASASPAASTATLNSAASLPAELLLKPKAANCASLRSGSYRIIELNQPGAGGGQNGFATDTITIDATALKGTDKDGSFSFTPAELAGDWNSMSFDRVADNDPDTVQTLTLTASATGTWSNITVCSSLASGCRNPTTGLPKMVADGSGGFYLQGSDWRDRLYAYRAGGGELLLISQTGSGKVGFSTRKVARTLPAVGEVSESWNLGIVPSGTATASFTVPGAVSQSKSTVASLGSGQYVRNAVTDFATGVTQPETIAINQPRDGYGHRVAASGVARSDGTTANVGEWFVLTLRGMGISAVGFPASGQNQLLLAVSPAQ